MQQHPNDASIFIPSSINKLYGSDIGITYTRNDTGNGWTSGGSPIGVTRDLRMYCEQVGSKWIYKTEPSIGGSIFQALLGCFIPSMSIVGYQSALAPQQSALDQQYNGGQLRDNGEQEVLVRLFMSDNPKRGSRAFDSKLTTVEHNICPICMKLCPYNCLSNCDTFTCNEHGEFYKDNLSAKYIHNHAPGCERA